MSESNSPAAALNGQSGQPDPATLEAVLECVSAVAKERAANLTAETNVVKLGLDSLERMEIIGALEQRFNGQFPDDVLLEIETCTEIARAVEECVLDQPVGLKPGEYPPEYYQFDKLPEYRQLKQQLGMMAATGEPVPFFKVHDGVCRDTTNIDGREYINFSGYNYVGMSGDPQVTAASQAAVEKYGAGFASGPSQGGRHPLHEEFESELRDFLGAEDILTFVGGHITNETTIGHLFGPGDLVLHDALAHNSIIQGAMLSRSRRRAFEHNSPKALDEILTELRSQHRHALVAIEGAYSMDGDYPDLPAFLEVARKHNAMLFVDEAHSIGVMGLRGRGICEHFGIPHTDLDISMGTLSKTFGSCGGYI
ncbi:MAG: aminotransferase class I/II-fold pyridoxal phosphate-dependent enzyme, partial [bacterium]|nr:aminotransferase class I/II-fold pyridoxal phosphate-dependent enzyme [bacterium]